MQLFRMLANQPEFRIPAQGTRPFDFDFLAPAEENAHALATWLRAHTQYDVEVEHRPTEPGAFFTGWRVGGQTPPLDPSPRIFEQWLTFVVDAGMAHDCELEACSGIDLAVTAG